jgi:hypothetical protein
LKSTDARFVEVEFPRQLRPRLVIEFSGAAFFLRMLLLSVRSYIPSITQKRRMRTAAVKSLRRYG